MLASFGVIYAYKTKCYSGGHFVQGRKWKAEDEGFTQQEVPELEKKIMWRRNRRRLARSGPPKKVLQKSQR
jgi:hypothetical protein